MPSAVLGNGIKPSCDSSAVEAALEAQSIPTHPLGVKPLGNQYLHDGPRARGSIGSWAPLPDEIIMLLMEILDKPSLTHLGATCKFMFAVCHSEEIWKALFLRYVTLPKQQFGRYKVK